MSSTCTVHKGQVCRTDDDDDDLVSSWSVLRGYIKLAVIFATCPSAPALPARLAHWYWNSAVTGVRGPHGGWGSPGVNSGEHVPLFFSLPLSRPPKTGSRLFPLKWASHHIHVLASSRTSRTAAAGGGGEPETNSVHTHIYIHCHTHTRPQPGLSASRPTSAQLCHTIHLLISALPPLTAAEPSEQTWRPQTFLPPSRPSEDAEGIPHQYPHRFTASPESDGTYSSTPRLPQSQSVSRAELSSEGGQREEKERRRGKKKVTYT